jgi:hypothetical protein
MNGQMYQICSIVAASKKAIQSDGRFKYSPAKYENTIVFSFLPEKKIFGIEKYTAPNVSAWFEHIRKKGLQDIKFLCPYIEKDRRLLGFSNTTESSIFCFFKGGAVSYFVPDWQFDSEKGQWNILYSEYECPNPPSEKPCFENNADSFRQVLSDIQNLAVLIGCENFAHIFGSAQNLLDGVGEYPDERYGLELPPLPQGNLQIFEAASLADVFGAMGSWNDSPLDMAHEKGLDKEYEHLSSELLKSIRLSILYAINEW